MKKFFALLTILILVLGAAACGGGKTPSTTEASTAPATQPTTAPPEPTTVPTTAPVTDDMQLGGVNLSGMSVEEGIQALNEAAAAYKLVLRVNGKRVSISGTDLTLAVDKTALEQYMNPQTSGGKRPAAVVTYDRGALCSLLASKLNTDPQNAGITYSNAKKQFVAAEGINGTEYDVNAVADAAGAAIGLLCPEAEVKVTVGKIAPEIGSGSEKVQSALNTANGYLKVSLTYSYTPDGGDTSKETISPSTLASFVHVSDELAVSVSRSAIERYASTMSERYSGSDYKGKFKTTGGGTIGSQVTYYGQRIDQTALTDDIYKCVTEGISGTRTAPYSTKSDKPYGGSYVEINLSSQHLWVYRNGERVVSTDLVSGSVAEDCCTPTGVYSIYAKQTDRYLTGETYRSYVHYWMPFLGGYGLHDASWRSSFGGEIYLYDGSHGCVNLPSGAAKKVYNNVQVGTKVILYGGKTEVADLQQKITGTTSYTVQEDAAPFRLDAKLKYSGTKLLYSSSDPAVVKVSSDGTVTVTGVGRATITVSAEAFEFYTAAELKIEIVVNPARGETVPTEPTNPPTEPTDPPTEPTDPPTKPTDPPTKPTDPPTEPTDPPTEPTDPPTEPTNPPTE